MTIQEELFEWIYQTVDGKGFRQLLNILYEIEFKPVMVADVNRVTDGCNLRYMFGHDCNIPKRIIDVKFDSTRCSVLEMIFGLAVRVEDTIMADSDYGDRTNMWFWIMIKSLGLYGFRDGCFDKEKRDGSVEKINNILTKFLNRTYERDGSGGLFTVKDSDKDMRDIEIWYQMSMFMNKLL